MCAFDFELAAAAFEQLVVAQLWLWWRSGGRLHGVGIGAFPHGTNRSRLVRLNHLYPRSPRSKIVACRRRAHCGARSRRTVAQRRLEPCNRELQGDTRRVSVISIVPLGRGIPPGGVAV